MDERAKEPDGAPPFPVVKFAVWGGIATLATLLLAGGLIPLFFGQKERAPRLECASNLHQLGLALRQYALDDSSAYPDRLEQLFCPVYVPDARLFRCPHPPHRPYLYVSGLRADDPPEYVVVYEPAENHESQGMNVLYVDGHAEWKKDRLAVEAQARLQRQTLTAQGRTLHVIPVDIK